MPITNSIPDADRYSSYEPVTETTEFPVGFVLFSGDAEEAKSEIEVRVDGVIVENDDFSIEGTFDLTTDFPVCTDAAVVFPDGLTDVHIEIEGKRTAERVTQLPSGQGIAPHYWNIILNRIYAMFRELWQRLDRVPMMPYGEDPPTPEEMLAWRDYILDPGEVISVQGRTGAVTITKADVGLGNVPNYPVASQAEAEAGGATDKLMTPERTAEAIVALAPGAALPPGTLYGLSLANNAADSANDVDIGIGEARDDGDAADLVLSSALTKRLDAAWVVGTNQGGLDTGSKAASTRYYVWLIRRSDTGVVDVLFSTSATSPTMPTNYTQKRLIGSFETNGSSAIIGGYFGGPTGLAKALAVRPLLHLQDRKTSGTDGGTFTSGAWRTRTLNTKVTDEVGSALSSSQFSLTAGTYEIRARVPVGNSGSSASFLAQAKLRNVTDGSDTLIGGGAQMNYRGGDNWITGRFTIAAQKTFEIQHRISNTHATVGLGSAAGFGVTEIYTDVMIWKIA